METLVTTEAHVIKSVKSYLPKVSGTDKKRQIKRFIAECEKEHAIATKNIPKHIMNPINAYRLIKRLTRDLNSVEQLLKENTYYIRNSQLTYPSEEDLLGALWAINQLTIVYGLNFTQLANGILINDVSSPMTASDCYELGLAAQEYREFSNAISWMIEALRKYKSCEDCMFTDVEIMDFISRNFYIIGDFDNSLHWREKTLTMNLTVRQKEEYTNIAEYLRKTLLKNANNEKKQTKEDNNNKINNGDLFLDRLCAENLNSSIYNKSLSCYYKTSPQPYLKMAPLKVEVLHLNPTILMSPDFLTDAEIGHLIKVSKPLLKQTGTNFLALKLSHLRTAQVATLDSSYQLISRLTRRVTHFTDLKTLDREIEVANYGIGGYYAPHYDPQPIEKHNHKKMIPGHKIATVFMYLSDVKLGGATIFPLLNVTVFPKRGTAVFWKNLFRSGNLDQRALYGECPVLRGNKWVSTKWISVNNHYKVGNAFEF